MTTPHGPKRPTWMVGAIIALAAMALASCTSVHTETNPDNKVQKKVQWSFEKKSVVLDVLADPDLNLSDKRPHTLVIGILELQDPNAFLPLIQDPDRAMETLAVGKKRAGILAMWRFIIPPGAHQLLTVDRMNHAQYLGVIAGYSQYSAKQDIVLRPLPVTVKRTGIIFRRNHYRPARTLASIWLGRRHLLGMAVLDPRAKEANQKPAGNGTGSLN